MMPACFMAIPCAAPSIVLGTELGVQKILLNE